MKFKPEFIIEFTERWDEITTELKKYNLSSIRLVPKISDHPKRDIYNPFNEEY